MRLGCKSPVSSRLRLLNCSEAPYVREPPSTHPDLSLYHTFSLLFKHTVTPSLFAEVMFGISNFNLLQGHQLFKRYILSGWGARSERKYSSQKRGAQVRK